MPHCQRWLCGSRNTVVNVTLVIGENRRRVRSGARLGLAPHHGLVHVATHCQRLDLRYLELRLGIRFHMRLHKFRLFWISASQNVLQPPSPRSSGPRCHEPCGSAACPRQSVEATASVGGARLSSSPYCSVRLHRTTTAISVERSLDL